MALRILTQVNYSAGENPDGDSGLNFTVGLLRALVRLESKFHFYVLVPERHQAVWTDSLSHPQITPIPIQVEPRLHGGDFQFCPVRLLNSFDFRQFDVDVLFLNQPETAPALLQFFNRQTFHNVPALAYVHWFDTRRPSTPKQTLHEPAILGALSGMMVSSAVGCNSLYGKTKILDQSSAWFRESAINRLSERLQILPPGVDAIEIERHRPKRRRRGVPRILVNHRLLKYTGVRSLLNEVFPKLWSQRQDFSVLVTNPTRVRLPGKITNAPWLTVQTLSRSEYMRQLWDCDIVISPHRACHWSISTIEAICAECVPLMNRESFFAELMSPLLDGLSASDRKRIEARWYYFRGGLVKQISSILDNLPAEKKLSKRVATMAKQNYDWNALAPHWRQIFLRLESQIPLMANENPSMRRILEFLKQNKRISKVQILKHLKWAPKQRALSWTAFRNQLKKVAYEDPAKPESVFELPKHRQLVFNK